MRTLAAAFLLLAACALPAQALTMEEILQLSRAGVSDDVLVSQIQADGTVGQVSASQIDALRRSNVSEAVLRALGSGPAPAAAERESAPPSTEVPAQVVPGPGESLIVVRNEDRRTIAVAIDPGRRVIEFAEGSSKLTLAQGRESALALPYGVYTVVWRGEAKTYRVSTRAGERTDLILLSIDSPEVEGLRLRVLRNGRDFGSTTLHLVAKAPPVVEAPPRTVVMAPPSTVIVQPQTVVVPAPCAPVYYEQSYDGYYGYPAAYYGPYRHYGGYYPPLHSHAPGYWGTGCGH